MSGSLSTRLPVILAVFLCARFSYAEPPDIPDRPPPLTFEEHVDYVAWYNEFVRRGRDEKDNAYPLYLKLCPDKDGKGGFPKPEGKAAEQFEKASGRVWTEEEFPELAAYLERCEDKFQFFESCTVRSGYWERAEADDEVFLSSAGNVSCNCRDVLKSWSCRVWNETHHNAGEIVRFSTAAMKLSSQLEKSSYPIDALVAIACRAFTYDLISRLFSSGVLDRRQGSELYELCSKKSKDSVYWTRIVLTDWTACLHDYQALFRKARFDPEVRDEILQLLKEGGSDETIEQRLGNANLLLEIVDRFYKERMDIVSGTPTRSKLAKLREQEERLQRARKTRETMLWPIRPFFRSYELALRLKAQRLGTLAMLALHVHYAKHGEWPKSLKAIDKKLGLKDLKKIIVDPYSDEPFVYKLEDGNPLLYSVGVDGKDDGGVYHSRFGDGATGPADFVFWPYQKPEPR